MYESEKARLKPFLNLSDDERYNMIISSIRAINRACTNIFNGDSRNVAIEILRSTSVWALKCDGVCNSREIVFLEGFFKKADIKTQNWSSFSASDSKALLNSIISAAKTNVYMDSRKQKDYSSLIDFLAALFGAFLTADRTISDSKGQALNEFVKMCLT